MRRWVVAAAAVTAIGLSGCGLFGGPRPASSSAVTGTTQTGIASWYGPGFHGNPTSSGEIFDQDELTAAHQTLPLGTRVAVTNMENGRSVEVRVNDRGPFVDGRIIDLSHAAARSLGMIGPGTAPVRLEVLGQRNARTETAAFALQVGAFADPRNAEQLKASLEKRFAYVRVATLKGEQGCYYRVRVGRFARRVDAVEIARTITPLGLPTVIVEDPGP